MLPDGAQRWWGSSATSFLTPWLQAARESWQLRPSPTVTRNGQLDDLGLFGAGRGELVACLSTSHEGITSTVILLMARSLIHFRDPQPDSLSFTSPPRPTPSSFFLNIEIYSWIALGAPHRHVLIPRPLDLRPPRSRTFSETPDAMQSGDSSQRGLLQLHWEIPPRRKL